MQHHAAVARKIHLSRLFRFPQPPLITGADVATAGGYLTGLGTGYHDDGVHLTASGCAAFFGPLLQLFETVSPNNGGSPHPPWTQQPALVGLGSLIGTTALSWSNIGLHFLRSEFDTYSLQLKFGGRSIRLQGTAGTDILQLRGSSPGTGGEYSVNILPAAYQLDTWNGPRRKAIVTSTGQPVYTYYDADRPNGRMLVELGGMRLMAITPSQLSTFAAGNMPGMVLAVDYGSNLVGIVISAGGSWSPMSLRVPGTAPSPSSPGAPGWYRVGLGYRYDYTGDGTSHAWVRSAVESTW